MCSISQIIITKNQKCGQCKFQALTEGLKICANDDPDSPEHERSLKRSQEVRKINEFIQQYTPNSKYLDDLMDLSATIVEAMAICGVHECKARNANDVLITAFLQFTELPSEKRCNESKKRINKDNFFADMYRVCPLRKTELLITYALAKYSFRAFYYRQTLIHYDPGFIDVCQWKKAVKKMFEAFLRLNKGNHCEHILQVEHLLKCCFDSYVRRCRSRNRCGKGQEAVNNNSSIGTSECERRKPNTYGSLFNKPHEQLDLGSWVCQSKKKSPGDPDNCVKSPT